MVVLYNLNVSSNVKSQTISEKKEKRDCYYVNKAICYVPGSFLSFCVSLSLKNGLHLIRPVKNKKINNNVLSSLINKDI